MKPSATTSRLLVVSQVYAPGPAAVGQHLHDAAREIGNLSPVHPVDTILQAARELRDDPRLLFVFVGDGGQKARIEEAVRRESLSNVRLLPYQPLEELRYSLSAADVHLVVMGATMVGIVHPCTVYGAMAAARPILCLGPARSHIGELVHGLEMGWQVIMATWPER